LIKLIKKKNRFNCWKCEKKIGYTGFLCKCGYYFCGAHRLDFDHCCDFDYKAKANSDLAKNNTVIPEKKIDLFR